MNSYWDKFEILDNLEDLDDDNFTEESDDDIDMKELVGAAGGNLEEDEYNEDMINDEIEKFERFKQIYLLAEIESLTSQDGEIKLPSKSIGQEYFGSIDRRIK